MGGGSIFGGLSVSGAGVTADIDNVTSPFPFGGAGGKIANNTINITNVTLKGASWGRGGNLFRY